MPGWTEFGLRLAERLTALGRGAPSGEVLLLGGLAFRSVLWHPELNLEDDDGGLVTPPPTWPATPGLLDPASTPGLSPALRAATGVELQASEDGFELGELLDPPAPTQREALRAEACVAELGGVTLHAGQRYATGRKALELAIELVSTVHDHDPAACWAALRSLALELRASRASAAAFFEEWALELEDRGQDGAGPRRRVAACCRATAAAARRFLAAWAPDPETLDEFPDRYVAAADPLRDALERERDTALALAACRQLA